jgi:hypothetical protein
VPQIVTRISVHLKYFQADSKIGQPPHHSNYSDPFRARQTFPRITLQGLLSPSRGSLSPEPSQHESSVDPCDDSWIHEGDHTIEFAGEMSLYPLPDSDGDSTGEQNEEDVVEDWTAEQVMDILATMIQSTPCKAGDRMAEVCCLAMKVFPAEEAKVLALSIAGFAKRNKMSLPSHCSHR